MPQKLWLGLGRQSDVSFVTKEAALESISKKLAFCAEEPGDAVTFTYHRLGEIGKPNFVLLREGNFLKPDVLLPRFMVCDLRDATYIPGEGAWFRCSLTFTHEKGLEASFDYLSPPEIVLVSGEPLKFSSLDVAAEFNNWPREPQNVPGWLKLLAKSVGVDPPSEQPSGQPSGQT